MGINGEIEVAGEIAGLKKEVKNLYDNDKRHEEMMRALTIDIQCIRKELIKEISNRLPTWAVFLLSGLTAAIGWLASMVML